MAQIKLIESFAPKATALDLRLEIITKSIHSMLSFATCLVLAFLVCSVRCELNKMSLVQLLLQLHHGPNWNGQACGLVWSPFT